ncbi:unnamed protein product [Cochlearia groenlandica]
MSFPLCYNNTKTMSFRFGDDMIKTVNSVFFDDHNVETESPESWFTNSSETETTSHTSDSDHDLDADSIETVVRGVVRSDRLFFDPNVTSSIFEKSKSKSAMTEREDLDCVAVAMESEDPYGDFRRSMEEMVNSNGELAKDWSSLESMLAWYLKMNGKKSHGVIVSAFVDLFAGFSDSGGGITSVTESARYSTAVSSLTSSPLYLTAQGQTEIEEERSC